MKEQTKGKDGKATGGVIFSKGEEDAVKGINEVSRKTHDGNREIGRIVAELVEEKGGTVYGEQTLKRLARHPALTCSEEHLRRCWQYHRMMRDFGAGIRKATPRLSYSHHYQLSRLLDIGDKAVEREAIFAMAKKATDERLTVTALQAAVSTHLASIGKAIRGKSRPKDSGTTPEATEPDAYESLIDTTKTLVVATEGIVAGGRSDRIADLKKATCRLGFAYVQLVQWLARAGDMDAAGDARTVVDALLTVMADAESKADPVAENAATDGGGQNEAN